VVLNCGQNLNQVSVFCVEQSLTRLRMSLRTRPSAPGLGTSTLGWATRTRATFQSLDSWSAVPWTPTCAPTSEFWTSLGFGV